MASLNAGSLIRFLNDVNSDGVGGSGVQSVGTSYTFLSGRGGRQVQLRAFLALPRWEIEPADSERHGRAIAARSVGEDETS